MKNTHKLSLLLAKWHYAILVIIMMALANHMHAQDRDGSIDLTADNSLPLFINSSSSTQGLGIEGDAFTVEGWVYMKSQDGSDFNFFKFQSGKYKISLAYRGDAKKTRNDAWKIETQGLEEHPDHDWSFGYNIDNYSPISLLSKWTHIAFTVDDRSTVHLYLNGQLAYKKVLTISSKSIPGIYRDGGGGTCQFSGISLEDRTAGRLRLAELRVWDAELSGNTIRAYMNEQVNQSHPHWQQLYRYYHGNESEGTGTSIKFANRSPNSTYRAFVHKKDVSVNRSFTPAIKPPRPLTNFTATATDCQESEILVSWDSFRDHPTYITGSVIPQYAVYRYNAENPSDSSLLKTTSATTFIDKEVAPGATVFYRIYTRWRTNDFTHYSSTALQTGEARRKTTYEAPSGLSATEERCDGTVQLKWSFPENPPAWTVKIAKDRNFDQVVQTVTGIASDSRTYTHEAPQTETIYYYMVKQSGTSPNGCEVIGTFSSPVKGISFKEPESPLDITAQVNNADKTITVSWTNPTNSGANGYKIERTLEDGTDPVTIVIENRNQTSYTDKNAKICTTYRYKIAAFNDCLPEGNFSEESQTAKLEQDLSTFIHNFEVSKGYFGNAVKLEWEINGNLSQIDRFLIERKAAGEANYQLLKVVESELFYYDESALAGTFYDYRIYGESSCEEDLIRTNQSVDKNGFRQPFGIVNGHIAYEGGNPVANVTVSFEKTSDQNNGKSLYFDGTGDYVTVDPIHDEQTSYTGLSIEAWIKSTAGTGQDQAIFSATSDQSYALLLNGSSQLTFEINEPGGQKATVSTNTAVADGDWHHVAAVFEPGKLSLYLDGAAVDSTFAENLQEFTPRVNGQTLLGAKASGETIDSYFTGNIDEIRIWQRARPAMEIKRDYNRYISSDQKGLALYHRADEGTGQHIYDISRTQQEYHKRNGTLMGDTRFSDDIPSSDQFGIKALTNQFGDYSADYIPYSGAGSIFRVTPSFKQHAFSPNTKSVYLGDGASIQNNFDFRDVSSFIVSGKVTYDNSEVPVEGVEIRIDGESAFGPDNQPVSTDQEGNYQVKVPIGWHYLSAHKDDHTFNRGVFPEKADDVFNYHEFTEDLIVNFTDDTKVKVVGRVVGGEPQRATPLGFHQSVNNIGVATVRFKLQREGYDLDTGNEAVYDQYELQTDSSSGEFSISLIPEKWTIEQVGNDRYALDPEQIPEVDLSLNPDTVITSHRIKKDSIFASCKIKQDSIREDSVTYNHALQYIIRSQPTVNVFGNRQFPGYAPFIGEDTLSLSIIKENAAGEKVREQETIPLGVDSPFGYPVFQMNKVYEANIQVFEAYNNPNHPEYQDDPSALCYNKVFVEGAEVIINNDLMHNPAAITGSTDENGVYRHDFRAGLPNLLESDALSFTKTFEVEVKVDGLFTKWRDGDPYRAYVLGAKPLEGTNFITYGPDHVDIVLRDPPGSNSYAYIEKGSSYSTAETWEFSHAISSELVNEIKNGLKSTLTDFHFVSESSLGTTIVGNVNRNGNYSKTITFNERIETSADPGAVGAQADLYIGRSLNLYLQETRNLGIWDREYAINNGIEHFGNGKYVVGLGRGFMYDDSQQATHFAYSQKHITTELIPELYILRNTILASNTNYNSNLPVNHRCYGFSNDSKCIKDFFQLTEDNLTDENRSYDFTPTEEGEIDSVAWLNIQLTAWMNAIALNESEKVKAVTRQNISIDGSSGPYSSELKEEFNSAYNWTNTRNITFASTTKLGLEKSGKGATFETKYNQTLDLSEGTEDVNNKSISFGYVIADNDESDYHSIDIKTNPGISLFNAEDFVDNIKDKEKFAVDKFHKFGSGNAIDITNHVLTTIGEATKKSAGGVGGTQILLSSIRFGADFVWWLIDMTDLSKNVTTIVNKANDLQETGISGFGISSPIFITRGGQTACPHEPESYTSFYLDENEDFIKLNTGTLRKEVPVIDATPKIVTNVPVGETANYTLTLGNDSESGSDLWYQLSIDQSTNPHGAILEIDGNTADRAFPIKASETITKTLSLAQGPTGVLEYDSIAVVLHSICQSDPTSFAYTPIADTVYLSARFLPVCSKVAIDNFNENWVLNYEDDNNSNVRLSGFDINNPLLDRIAFQYRALGDNPRVAMTFFKDTSSSQFKEYTGSKALLEGGELSFNWNYETVTDRQYQVRAVSYCKDESVYESDYLLGTIDRQVPVVFGETNPTDGIYNAGDDLMVTFNETLEAALVKDHNISLRSIQNGADVSHATSVQLAGAGDKITMKKLSFNGKSFTIECWVQNETESTPENTQWFRVGRGNKMIKVAQTGQEMIFRLGADSLMVTPIFSTDFPWHSWHHWAFTYDKTRKTMTTYLDGVYQDERQNVDFDASNTSNLVIGKSAFKGNLHELRIWEDVRTKDEITAHMSQKLAGTEPGLYGYWPMDEGRGNVARDKVAARTAAVGATWSLRPGGYSWEFTGTNHLIAPSANVTIDKETDMTIEFWVYANMPQDSMTIFSNGIGRGQDAYVDSHSVMNCFIAQDGKLYLFSNGETFQLTNSRIADGKWHHVALVVDRRTTARSYLDGIQQRQTDAGDISSFYGTNIYLGTTVRHQSPTEQTFDKMLTGKIDEFRIWNATRSQQLIEAYQHSKVPSGATGLVSYIPFEQYLDDHGTYLMNPSLSDQVVDSTLVTSSDEQEHYSDQKPPIRDVRGLQDIPFSYVVNDDQIIIQPNADMSRLEGQVMEISVKNVRDLYGNRQLSPVTWTAYVQQSEVRWNKQAISLEKHIDEEMVIKASFTNQSGLPYRYSLENIPSWMTAQVSSGTVAPLQTVEVVFTISPALNIGHYEHHINLTTDQGFDEKLQVSLRVYEDGPGWTVSDQNFQYSMNVFGKLVIDDEISADPNDMVAAFVGDEVRGVANLQYVEETDTYITFLSIGSDTPANATVTFSIYDASTGRVFDHVVPESISFQANAIRGSILEPMSIRSGQKLSGKIDLHSGWNWISFNLDDPRLSSVDNTMGDIGQNGDIVKFENLSDAYSNATGWIGDLTNEGGFKAGRMYKVRIGQPGTILLTGRPFAIQSNPVKLEEGWNHLGYLPQIKMTLNEALAQMNPLEGDLIKTENNFAVFDPALGWVGTLKLMEPGQGYMLRSSRKVTFKYPKISSFTSGRSTESAPSFTATIEVVAETNMSLIAKVEGESANKVLMAYSKEALVGYAEADELGRYFISIAGNQEADVTFKLLDVATGTTKEIAEHRIYSANSLSGSVKAPVLLTIAGKEEAPEDLLQGIVVAPTPFTDLLQVTVPMRSAGKFSLQLFDLKGRLVVNEQITADTPGNQVFILREQVETLRNGVYLLRVHYNGTTKTVKVIK